ncbi:ABC transporter permease [Alicyclobacillus acidiphilus]|uniref:ABC transporter permease n=1 Tax=Alicyclobacillus acidiphilus TaxID=182455 RepID=UPI00082A145B|nr:ribose ABC transporter permease [Alicyclobacillus acidiphilus]
MDWVRKYRLGPLIGFVILFIVLSILSSQFLTFDNLRNVALQTTVNALLSVGMTFVILTSGIDLSVGSTLALSSAIAAQLMVSHVNVALACIVGVVIGGLAGALNGLLVSYGNLAPFIVTLGTQQLFRGLTEVYTQGMPIYNLPTSFTDFGTGTVLGIPIPVILAAIMFIAGWIVLRKTVIGRKIYALGGNLKVAHLAGIKVKRYLVWVYVACGVLAALGGLVLTARLGSAESTAGTGYELNAITAVVLGGTSLLGGEGSVIGTLIGALILGVIDDGLNLLNVNSFWQDAVTGLIILIAILLDRKKSR